MAFFTAEQLERDAATRPGPKFWMRYLGDPVLSQPCKRLLDAGDIPYGLLDTLKREMANCWAESLGLAAPQVGAPLQLAIAMLVDVEATDRALKSAKPKDRQVHRRPVLMINPRLLDASAEKVVMVEGCLSVPNFRATQRRYTWVRVEYLDEAFTRQSLRLEGMDAQIVQHELDHLAGVLITDGLSRQLRLQAERQTAKYVQKRGAR